MRLIWGMALSSMQTFKMKLLLERWDKFINENKSWRDTSWETDDDKVTFGDVVDYLEEIGDETVDVNVGAQSGSGGTWTKNSEEQATWDGTSGNNSPAVHLNNIR